MAEPIGCDGEQTPLGVDQARRVLLNTIGPVRGRERVPVRAALGRVLARDLVALFDVPAHDNSAMDGYAVRAGDLQNERNRLTLVGAAFAGHPFSGVVGANQAVRIMTGGLLPRGADSVVIQEHAEVDGDTVTLPPPQRVGQHVRRAGEDLAAGKVALPAGTRLGPAELGLVASLGHSEVTVFRRPRIAIFATGDELTGVGRPLGPGEVYDSNRYTLYGVLRRLDAEVLDMGVVRNEPQALRQAFADATEQADAILTTGGVSVGDADHVHDIMTGLGEVCFWKVDIKPGRPMAFGRLGDSWLFGLPGNPVAALVNYYQIVLDALHRLAGEDPLPPRPSFRVRCTEPIRKLTGRREFPRGVLFEQGGEWVVRLTGNQGSGVLRSMVEGNCFIILPEDGGDVSAGDRVEVQPFDGLI
jgi:molybdopterin molybdotransferase